MILLPKVGQADYAIIIEYKIAKPAEDLAWIASAGLQQITDKQYAIKLKAYTHVKKILKIAMAFCGKEVALQYQIDDH